VDDRPSVPRSDFPAELDHLLAMCASCSRLHPDGYRCSCLAERASALAEMVHEWRRLLAPGWRRPRTWDALPELVRATRTRDALDLVDLVEACGWRLVSTYREPRHALPEPEPAPDTASRTAAMVGRFVPDPDATTPPSGEFRVPNVIR